MHEPLLVYNSIRVIDPDAPRDWKEYEREIADYFRSEYPDALITPNAKIIGKFSKVERQIDLLIEDQASDLSFRVVVT